MAIPPALIGAIARNTDWRLTDYDPYVTPEQSWEYISFVFQGNGTKVEHIPPDQVQLQKALFSNETPILSQVW